jgi:hypothetical protein
VRHTHATPSRARFRASRRRLLTGMLTTGIAAMVALFAAGSASACCTRGFNIINESGYVLTGFRVTRGSFRHGFAGPPAGSSIPLGGSAHFEVTFQFAEDNFGDIAYDIENTRYPTLDKVIAHLKVNGFGTPTMDCLLPGYGECNVNGTAATFRDPRDTKYNVPQDQREHQASVLDQLCVEGSIATCTFAVKSEVPVESPSHAVGGYIENKSDTEKKYVLPIKDTVGYTSSVGITGAARTKIKKLLEVAIPAAYGHPWSAEHTFEQTVEMAVPPHHKCSVTGTAPMLRNSGEFKLTMGNSTWHLSDVSFESPDARPAPANPPKAKYGYVIECVKLTSAQR